MPTIHEYENIYRVLYKKGKDGKTVNYPESIEIEGIRFVDTEQPLGIQYNTQVLKDVFRVLSRISRIHGARFALQEVTMPRVPRASLSAAILPFVHRDFLNLLTIVFKNVEGLFWQDLFAEMANSLKDFLDISTRQQDMTSDGETVSRLQTIPKNAIESFSCLSNFCLATNEIFHKMIEYVFDLDAPPEVVILAAKRLLKPDEVEDLESCKLIKTFEELPQYFEELLPEYVRRQQLDVSSIGRLALQPFKRPIILDGLKLPNEVKENIRQAAFNALLPFFGSSRFAFNRLHQIVHLFFGSNFEDLSSFGLLFYFSRKLIEVPETAQLGHRIFAYTSKLVLDLKLKYRYLNRLDKGLESEKRLCLYAQEHRKYISMCSSAPDRVVATTKYLLKFYSEAPDNTFLVNTEYLKLMSLYDLPEVRENPDVLNYAQQEFSLPERPQCLVPIHIASYTLYDLPIPPHQHIVTYKDAFEHFSIYLKDKELFDSADFIEYLAKFIAKYVEILKSNTFELADGEFSSLSQLLLREGLYADPKFLRALERAQGVDEGTYIMYIPAYDTFTPQTEKYLSSHVSFYIKINTLRDFLATMYGMYLGFHTSYPFTHYHQVIHLECIKNIRDSANPTLRLLFSVLESHAVTSTETSVAFLAILASPTIDTIALACQSLSIFFGETFYFFGGFNRLVEHVVKTLLEHSNSAEDKRRNLKIARRATHYLFQKHTDFDKIKSTTIRREEVFFFLYSYFNKEKANCSLFKITKYIWEALELDLTHVEHFRLLLLFIFDIYQVHADTSELLVNFINWIAEILQASRNLEDLFRDNPELYTETFQILSIHPNLNSQTEFSPKESLEEQVSQINDFISSIISAPAAGVLEVNAMRQAARDNIQEEESGFLRAKKIQVKARQNNGSKKRKGQSQRKGQG